MQFMRQSAAERQTYTVKRQSPINGVWREWRISLRPVDIITHFVKPDFLHRTFPYLSPEELSFLRTGCTEHEMLDYIQWSEPEL